MSIESIKAALLHIPGIESLAMQYGGGGTPNIYKLGALQIPVAAKTSVEEAVAAIAAAVSIPVTAHVTPLPPASPIAPPPAAPAPASGTTIMSVTGLQEGAFAGRIADLKAKLAAAQTAGGAKIDAAAAAALVKVDATVAGVTARIDAEIEAALAELTIGNGGPA